MRNTRKLFGVFFIIIGIVGALFTLSDYMKTKYKSYEYIVESDVIDTIIVNNSVSTIDVVSTTDSKITIAWEEDGHLRTNNRTTIEEKGNEVEIVGDERSTLFTVPTFNFKQQKMIVYVPKEHIAAIDLTNAVGSILVKDIAVQKLHAETDVQRVVVSNVQAEEIYVSSSVGSIEIQNSSGSIVAKSNVGSIVADLETVKGDIDLRSDIGSVELILEEQPDNVSFIGRSDLGSVHLFNAKEPILIDQPEFDVNLQTDIGKVEARARK